MVLGDARMMMTKCLTHFLMPHKLNKKQCFTFAFDCISNEAERGEVVRRKVPIFAVGFPSIPSKTIENYF